MIVLDHITRTFIVGEQTVYALNDVSVSIDQGSYVSIMGPSGSGKSTLLNMLGLLDRPTSGTYRLNNVDVNTLPDVDLAQIRNRQIGFVFQSFHLIPRLTAAENIELPMVLAGFETGERKRRVDQILLSTGLNNRAQHKPEQLSGGQRQRVAIARATVMQPSILLADEPTGNLDRASGAEIIELLEKLNQDGITLIVVTHDPDLGKRARTHIRMVDGKLV